MTDTWGIPGTTFLWAFIAVAAVATIWTFARRAAVLKGTEQETGSGRDTLPPAHIAYLAEGPQRAIYASLALLRKANAIDVDEETGRFQRIGPLPAGAGNLDSAVLHAASQRLRDSQIRQDPAVRRALDQIRQDLERRGLLITTEQQNTVKRASLVMLALLVLGLVRLVAGMNNGSPVGYLLLTLLVLGVLTVVARRKLSGQTAAGRKYLADLKRTYHYLDWSPRPAYQTYDPVMIALGVGLFGTVVLLAADPVLAEQTDLGTAPPYSGSTYGDGGGGGGGDGCGGGCGGCGG
jgi:uncharacterized protein (TIGR04222 family)